jgi:hypothetical protein
MPDKTENSFRAKLSVINLLRDPSRQGMSGEDLFVVSTSIALPSGSLHSPPHIVFYLVLQRKEFKVDPNRTLSPLKGSAL